MVLVIDASFAELTSMKAASATTDMKRAQPIAFCPNAEKLYPLKGCRN